MLETVTNFHDMRANPHIMLHGKAAKYFVSPTKDVPTEFPPDTIQVHEFSDEELRMLDELKLRDSKVREEEEKHARMLGRHAGIIRYEYQIGPDGQPYVINGSVDVSPKFNSNNPDDIRKVLRTIQKAAVSVSNPSQADLNIATNAANKVANINGETARSKHAEEAESKKAYADSTKSLSLNDLGLLDTQA